MFPSEPTTTSRTRSNFFPPGDGHDVSVDQTMRPVLFATAITLCAYVSAMYTFFASLALPKGEVRVSAGDVEALRRSSTVPEVVISTRPLFPVSVTQMSLGFDTSS